MCGMYAARFPSLSLFLSHKVNRERVVREVNRKIFSFSLSLLLHILFYYCD